MSGYALALQLQRTRFGTRFTNPRTRQTTRSTWARSALLHGKPSASVIAARIQAREPSYARRVVRKRPRNNHDRLASQHPLPAPVYNNDRQKFEVKSSSAMETTHRYYDLRKHIKALKPDAVVSDGDIHALRLAERWHFPSVYITNVIRPTSASARFSTLANASPNAT